MDRRALLLYVATVPMMLSDVSDFVVEPFFYLTWFVVLCMVAHLTHLSPLTDEYYDDIEAKAEAKAERRDEYEDVPKWVYVPVYAVCVASILACVWVEEYDAAFCTAFMLSFHASVHMDQSRAAMTSMVYFMAALCIPSYTAYMCAYIATFGVYMLDIN